MSDIIQTKMLGYIKECSDSCGILRTGLLEDRTQYIKEAFDINRVLIDNGKFCCIERNKLSSIHMFSAIGEYFRFPTIFSLKRILRKYNFKINTIKGDSIALPFIMNKKQLALSRKVAKTPNYLIFLIIYSQKIK